MGVAAPSDSGNCFSKAPLLTLVAKFYVTHLSKGPSDLKQNGTQEKTPFSGTVFHGLSCGVVIFVPTVSFWNHQIEASHWLKEEF